MRECLCLSTRRVNEEMPTDTGTPLRVLQSTQRSDVSGLEQECVFFQLGHVRLFYVVGFFLFSKFLSAMPL